MKKIISVFIVADSLIWLLFGFIVLIGRHRGLPEGRSVELVITLLSLGTALAIPILYALYRKLKQTWAFYLLLLGLAAILFLTVADEFGWPDLVVLILHGIPFGLLIYERVKGS